jgi:hypothetical protein
LLYGNVTLLMQAVQTGRCAAAGYDAPAGLIADGTIDRLERTWLTTNLASLPVPR